MSRNIVKSLWVVTAVVLTTIIAHDTILHRHASAEEVRSGASSNAPTDKISSSTLSEIQANLSSTIASYPSITIGVSLIDLSSNQQYSYGSFSSFIGASTTKVLTAADFLSQVETGTASLDNNIDGQSAQSLLKAMVNQSDDNAWESLNDYLTYPQLQAYARSLGLTSYQWDGNTISASDEALLLEYLYEGKLLDKDDTALLLSYMQNTNNESLLPAALPIAARSYHKYGQYDAVTNDAAIVSYDNKNFVLTIYTSGNNGANYSVQTTAIHSITKAVTALL